jgi:hypothetical protein
MIMAANAYKTQIRTSNKAIYELLIAGFFSQLNKALEWIRYPIQIRNIYCKSYSLHLYF